MTSPVVFAGVDARMQDIEGRLVGYDGRFDHLDGSARSFGDDVTELR